MDTEDVIGHIADMQSNTNDINAIVIEAKIFSEQDLINEYDEEKAIGYLVKFKRLEIIDIPLVYYRLKLVTEYVTSAEVNPHDGRSLVDDLNLILSVVDGLQIELDEISNNIMNVLSATAV